MELDYDTHLKPATEIKKVKGENFAIDYLFEILSSYDWKYYDHWSILNKIAGYYKKANDTKRKKIIAEFHNLLEGNKQVDYQAKLSCYKRLSWLYEQEKDDEKAVQMLSGASANNHPESSSYLFEAADISKRNAQILSRKNLSIETVAADYLYWYFSYLFYTMAWYQIFQNDERPTVWKSNITPLFPFEVKSALQAFKTLSNNKSVELFSSLFKQLLFDTFPTKFKNHIHQTGAVEIINKMVNDYLNSIHK